MCNEITIWHNPRCSKSRQTLELLEGRGFKPRQIEYLKQSPEKKELREVISWLGVSAREIMRKGQDIYGELELDKEFDEEKLIEAMHLHPILIERPIVIYNGKASIGRPPEAVLDIL